VSHLRSRRWSSIIIFNHTIMELWRHSNNHVIIVWIIMSSFWYIKTKWRVIMISCQKIVWVVCHTGWMRKSFWKIWRPYSHVCIFCLMNSHVWGPHSIMNNSLSEIPLLEEVSSVFLMTWMNFWEVDHFIH